MGKFFRGNFHVNSLICYSQTLRDSRWSSLCLAQGRFEDPSNLVFKLIIALIWNIRSPFQYSKCRNRRVKTVYIVMITAITLAPGPLDFFGRIDLEFEADLLRRVHANLHIPKCPLQLVSTLSCIHELRSSSRNFLNFFSVNVKKIFTAPSISSIAL